MSFPNGPITALAPSIMRFIQFAQRKDMAKKKPSTNPEPSLPGELPLSQQVGRANSLEIEPSLLPPFPQKPLPPVPPSQGGVPMPDDMGRTPPPRIAQAMGSPAAPPPQYPAFARPAPLDLPERTYDIPPVVTPPTIAPPPTRDIASENNRAMQAALIPAGLGLLLGGAPAAAAGGAAAFAANKARAEQEAAVANQEYGIKRSNDMAQYGLDRQEMGDKAIRVNQQMRVDQGRDVLLTRAKQAEWEAWNQEQDRLAKARTIQEGDTTKTVNALLAHRAKTADLMSTQPEDAQRRVAGDFNEIAASLGHAEMAFDIPARGVVFAMKPEDVNRNALAGLAGARTAAVPVLTNNTVANTNADNTRAEEELKLKKGQAQFDQWYKKRQIDISQGRLNMAQEKQTIEKEAGSVKTWEDAQGKIADYMAKAARLSEPDVDTLMNTVTPPTAEAINAASYYRQAAEGLKAKFGKGEKPSTASAPSVSQYSLPSGGPPPVTLPPIPVRGQTVQVQVPTPSPRPTPAPSVPAANNRLKSFAKTGPTPAPKPSPAPKKATPKPSATPKPAFLTKDIKSMTPKDIEDYRQYLRKKRGLK